MAAATITEMPVEKTSAPAVPDRALLLTSIAKMESELNALKAALGVEGALPLPTKGKGKAKKMKDPLAPKKEANSFIKFTVRVGNLFSTARAAAKEADDEERVKMLTHPATVNKQFCSYLKDLRQKDVEKDGKTVSVPDYDSWEDSAILEAFESWSPPEVSKMEAAGKTKKAKKAAADSASESGSVASSDADEEKPKERKKRTPLTEEQKAARKAKMTETKAKKAATATDSAESNDEAEAGQLEVAKPAPEPVKAAEPAPAKKAMIKPKTVAKKEEKTYTLDELKDFEPFELDGEDYGLNKRGDVVNSDGDFAGHWDGKKLNKAAKQPADWDVITA